MKAAFRGLRRKASSVEVESRRTAALDAEREEPRVPQVPRLPNLGRSSPMPSLRFSGLGLDNFVSNADVDHDASALEIEQELAGFGRHNGALGSSALSAADAQTDTDTDTDLDSAPPASTAIGRVAKEQQRQPASHEFLAARSSPLSEDDYYLLDVETAPDPPMPRSRSHANLAQHVSAKPSRSRTSSKRSDVHDGFHLLGANGHDDDDNRGSIEAVRNNNNNLDAHASPRASSRVAPSRSIRRSFSQPTLDEHSRSRGVASSAAIRQQPPKSSAPVAPRLAAQSSVSAILDSARKAKLPTPARSLTTLVPSDPPTEPSLFAYENGPGSGIKNAGKFKTVSSKSSSKTASINGKGSERATIRNARGEIEWKDPPPLPTPTAQHLSGLAYQHQVYQAQQRGIPVEALVAAENAQHQPLSRTRSRSPSKLDRRGDSPRNDSRSPSVENVALREDGPSASTSKIPYKAIGAATSPAVNGTKSSTRDGLRGMAASLSSSKLLRMGGRRPKVARDAESETTTPDTSRDEALVRAAEAKRAEQKEERRKAEQWEREREAQNAADRQAAILRKQQLLQAEEEEKQAKLAAERALAKKQEKERRDKEAAELAELEREAKEKRAAEKAARRQAKERAEREAEDRRIQAEKEAEERRKQRAKAAEEVRLKRKKEEEERRLKEEEEAEERRIREEEEAEERRIQEEEEAEERRIQEEKEAEERRIQEEKEKEEKRIRKAKEAEERKERRAEEKRRKKEEAELEKVRLAAEEEARLERERLEAIEAEARAEEEAERRKAEAIEAEERELADARRQVDEEDRAARKAGRRGARRMQRALAEGVDPTELDGVDDDNDDISDNGSDVWADAEDMVRSHSDLRAPSSIESSADYPVTPADEVMDVMSSQQREGWQKMSQPAASRGLDKAAGVHFADQDEAKEAQSKKANEAVPLRSDRFRAAIKGVARRTAPDQSTDLNTASGPTEDDDDLDAQIVQPNGPYREGGITYGRGWCAHGLADPSLVVSHLRLVRTLRAPTVPSSDAAVSENGAEPTREVEGEPVEELAPLDADESAPGETAEASASVEDGPVDTSAEGEGEAKDPEYDEVVYSDLGELIWTSTTPDVIARLVGYLDYADVKALRQTSQSIRFALGQMGGREVVLSRFLGQVGYQSWKPAKLPDMPEAGLVLKDPLPLSFSDCEAFLLSYDLAPEYHMVGAEYAKAPHKMDPRYPRLARATTRSYNRVLARLRMQPSFALPSSTQHAASQQRQQLSPTTIQAPFAPVDGTAVPSRSPNRSPALGSKEAFVVDGHGSDGMMPYVESLVSPWKPGRAALFRVWVPSREEGGWLSDSELSKCERELFIAGVWTFMQRGDVVWDCALGDERNVGKYMFDGRYLRDLSYMFDRTGHLPSWINAFSYAPSYYHNIIRSSSTAQPVVYLDVLPWRDQIVSTMRLVQDQVETFSPQGARYRISKWLYRAVINVTPGQIISDEGLEVVNEGWHGRIVIETEGTAEHAKELISRCAGPAESAQTKARLLASVMDADGRPRIPKAPAPTRNAAGQRIETTTPWAIIRARSRPGMIWIRPLDMRERVTF